MISPDKSTEIVTGAEFNSIVTRITIDLLTEYQWRNILLTPEIYYKHVITKQKVNADDNIW